MPEETVMWLASFQIPLRYKLYLFAAAAFVFGLVHWRNTAIENALAKLERQRREEADKALRTGREVRNDVEILDDVGLADRASEWVRNRND